MGVKGNVFQDKTIDDLHDQLEELLDEKAEMERRWMSPDDGEWNEVLREIDAVTREIERRERADR